VLRRVVCDALIDFVKRLTRRAETQRSTLNALPSSRLLFICWAPFICWLLFIAWFSSPRLSRSARASRRAETPTGLRLLVEDLHLSASFLAFPYNSGLVVFGPPNLFRYFFNIWGDFGSFHFFGRPLFRPSLMMLKPNCVVIMSLTWVGFQKKQASGPLFFSLLLSFLVWGNSATICSTPGKRGKSCGKVYFRPPCPWAVLLSSEQLLLRALAHFLPSRARLQKRPSFVLCLGPRFFGHRSIQGAAGLFFDYFVASRIWLARTISGLFKFLQFSCRTFSASSSVY